MVIPGVLLAFTLASGIWLHHLGRPLTVALFTVHKLIALVLVICASVSVYHLCKGTSLRALVVGALVVTGLLFLALFVTGALLNTAKVAHAALFTSHRLLSVLAVISATVTTYLLASGRSS